MNNIADFNQSGPVEGVIVKGVGWCVAMLNNRVRLLHEDMEAYQVLDLPDNGRYQLRDSRSWGDVGGDDLAQLAGFARCRFMYGLTCEWFNKLVVLADNLGADSWASRIELQEAYGGQWPKLPPA